MWGCCDNERLRPETLEALIRDLFADKKDFGGLEVILEVCPFVKQVVEIITASLDKVPNATVAQSEVVYLVAKLWNQLSQCAILEQVTSLTLTSW